MITTAAQESKPKDENSYRKVQNVVIDCTVRQHETTRKNMGYSRRYADRVNLVAMTPRGELSTTGYCLAAPGKEYLVYQPGEGPFQVQLKGGSNTTFAAEWFDPKTGTATDGKQVKAVGQVHFAPPFTGDAVLHLRRERP